MIEILQKYINNFNYKLSSKNNIVLLCPFHNEKTPSCFINTTSGLWYCQGCKQGGSFKRFLSLLNVPKGEIDSQSINFDKILEENRKREKLQNLIRFYKDPFLASPILNESLLIQYQYEPSYLITLGFKEHILNNMEILYDPVHMRIIYPIRDIYGNLAGVSGGTTIGAEPKYKLYSGGFKLDNGTFIPSPFGEWFDKEYPNYNPELYKQKCIWNYDRVYASILYSKKKEDIFIVEGFKAALWLIQNGYNNTIALMGSRLSHLQKILLERLDCTFYLMLDNDEAGEKGTNEIFSEFKGISSLKQVIYDKKQPDDLTPEELYKAILLARRKK